MRSRASWSTWWTGPSVVSSRSAKLRSSVGLGEEPDLVEVGAGVGAQERGDVVVGERLAPAEQCHARREPLDVPGEVAEVGLVEVVDVEDQHAVAVHVGAEVLRVQVALDPDAAGALVGPGVVAVGHVGVEEAGAAPVEGERVGRHLAELGAERSGIGRHEVGESVDQRVDDLRRTVTHRAQSVRSSAARTIVSVSRPWWR